jgi:hypothetical protein
VGLVEQDGDVPGGELLIVGLLAGAGSDGGGGVGGFVELLEEDAGELGEIGAVPLHDELWRAGVALGHGAGFAGIFIGGGGRDALSLEELCDVLLDGVAVEGGDVVGEVLDGVEEAVGFDDGDADGVEVGIEEIGAVGGGGHPDLLDGGGVFAAAGEIFSDGAEVGSGLIGAGEEIGFAGILVREIAGGADDPLGVGVRGADERTVPLQGREIVRGAGLVGELEEGLLGW